MPNLTFTLDDGTVGELSIFAIACTVLAMGITGCALLKFAAGECKRAYVAQNIADLAFASVPDPGCEKFVLYAGTTPTGTPALNHAVMRAVPSSADFSDAIVGVSARLAEHGFFDVTWVGHGEGADAMTEAFARVNNKPLVIALSGSSRALAEVVTTFGHDFATVTLWFGTNEALRCELVAEIESCGWEHAKREHLAPGAVWRIERIRFELDALERERARERVMSDFARVATLCLSRVETPLHVIVSDNARRDELIAKQNFDRFVLPSVNAADVVALMGLG